MRRSNRFTVFLAVGCTMASSLGAMPAKAERVEIGNAASVVGDVRMTNETIANRAVARKQRIAWADLIDTGERSQLQILLLDRSTFAIGARSRVRIDRFVYDPTEGRSVFTSFIKGALRFFSGRQSGENMADIETPAGRIGIRGTALDLLVGEDAEAIAESEPFVGQILSNKDEATLAILRGPGAGTAGGLTPGLAEVEGAEAIALLEEPGFAAYIPYNGAEPIGPFRISDKALARVQDLLAPEVARAAFRSTWLRRPPPQAAIPALTPTGAMTEEERVARLRAIQGIRSGSADQVSTPVQQPYLLEDDDPARDVRADVAKRRHDVAVQQEYRRQRREEQSYPSQPMPPQGTADLTETPSETVDPPSETVETPSETVDTPSETVETPSETDAPMLTYPDEPDIGAAPADPPGNALDGNTAVSGPPPAPQMTIEGTWRLADTSSGVQQVSIAASGSGFILSGMGNPVLLEDGGNGAYFGTGATLFGQGSHDIVIRKVGSGYQLTATHPSGGSFLTDLSR